LELDTVVVVRSAVTVPAGRTTRTTLRTGVRVELFSTVVTVVVG
jgi:hypothetical protein